MKDKDETKEQLLDELVELRQRIDELEKSEAKCIFPRIWPLIP